MARRDARNEPETVTDEQAAAAEDEGTPQPRERADADDVEAEQGDADEQARESAPEPVGDERRGAGEQQVTEQRDAEREQDVAGKNRDATEKILEAQGMTYDEGIARLTRDRGYADDLPLVSHTEAWETGYAGQVPDRTPNEAYQAGGDEDEAARADLRAATRGRLGND